MFGAWMQRESSKLLTVFVASLLTALFIQWRIGAWERELGFHPDESAHYVTGVMAREYLLAGAPANPLRYAEQYYDPADKRSRVEQVGELCDWVVEGFMAPEDLAHLCEHPRFITHVVTARGRGPNSAVNSVSGIATRVRPRTITASMTQATARLSGTSA